MLRRRGRPGGAAAAVAGVDAERPRAPAQPATAASSARSPVAVCTSQAPSRSAVHLAARHAPRRRRGWPSAERLAQLGATTTTRAASASDARRRPARGDRTAADDDDAASGEVEPEQRGHSACPEVDGAPDRPSDGHGRDRQVRSRPGQRRLARAVEAPAVGRSNTCLYMGEATVGSLAAGADDAARDHVRVAERVVLLDREHAVVGEAEERDLLAVDQRRGAALGREVVEGRRARGSAGRRRRS